jgi:hypothetical protein
MKRINHTVVYFYLIYENQYNFFVLTTTSTLLFPFFDPQYCGSFNLQITQHYYTNCSIHNTAKSILAISWSDNGLEFYHTLYHVKTIKIIVVNVGKSVYYSKTVLY